MTDLPDRPPERTLPSRKRDRTARSASRVATSVTIHRGTNIRNHGRADLFGKTLRHCLDRISARWPERLERLSDGLRAWHSEERNGWFGRGADAKAKRVVLQQRAEWLVEVLETFADDKEICADEGYELVARVVREQCEVVELQLLRANAARVL